MDKLNGAVFPEYDPRYDVGDQVRYDALPRSDVYRGAMMGYPLPAGLMTVSLGPGVRAEVARAEPPLWPLDELYGYYTVHTLEKEDPRNAVSQRS